MTLVSPPGEVGALTRTPSHRRCLLLFVALALLVATPTSARAAETGRSAQAENSRLIPVWAFVNGDAPLARGRVRIMAGRKPVRQTGGRVWKRTNAQGVAVLQMRRVPRRFTVVVRGGRAAGRRVRGSQHRIVTNYRDTRVVEVNPLTTLVTRLRRQRPALDNRRAAREVKRYFHVPQWADLGQNLRDMGDEWFDSRLYLRDVRRYGSIDRLNRVVARRILRGRAPRARRPSRRPMAAASQAGGGWLGMTPGQLVGAGLKYLGANLAGTITQGGIGAGLGALLQLAQSAGLITLPKSDMDQVREQLDAIGAQLTQLKGKIDDLTGRVERNNASQLLHQSDVVLGRIDKARADLALLANMTQTDPTRQNFAAVIDGYIANNLQDAPETLNLQLNPGLSIGDNVVKATSRALATDRFFDDRDSARVQQVYDYFAMYQLQLSVLLVNYWNNHPETYSLDTRRALMARIEANVLTTQKESIKPAVPAGTFFDTRTPRFMWGTDGRTRDALAVETEGLSTSTSLRVGPVNSFSNWQMPAYGDFRNLLEGAEGSPRSWLQDQVKVPLSNQLVWASDSIRLVSTPRNCWIRVTIMDLATGKAEQHGYGNSSWEWRNNGRCNLRDPGTAQFMRSKSGGLLLLRYLGPNESYWW